MLDLKDLPQALQKPVAVFLYGDPQKAQNIIVEIQSEGKHLEVITRLDEYGNPQADLTEVTVIEKNPQTKYSSACASYGGS